MKQSLQLKIGQQLTMTPQLQQAIRLLQLSTLDLQQEIQHALDSNPMLEMEEPELNRQEAAEVNSQSTLESNGATEANATTTSSETDFSANSSDTSNELSNSDDSFSTSDDGNKLDDNWSDDIPTELATDSSWDDTYQAQASISNSHNSEGDFDFEGRNSSAETLGDHLLWQLNLTPMTDQDRIIAMAIIDAVDASGMLSITPEEIFQGLEKDIEELEFDEVEAVRHRLQHFDPMGVASVDLRECLLVQLQQMSPATPWRLEAINIIDRHIKLLGTRDYAQLMRRTKLKEPQLRQTVELIQSLDPRPGDLIDTSETEYVTPDVFVSKQEGEWTVEINQDTAPKIRINDEYAGLIKRADNSDQNNFLRDNLQEAKWFLKSLQSRNETLMKVAVCIVHHQIEFFEHGPEAMKPLVLHDIAEAVEMHESTISRVTTKKYMHTPRGIFELKYFFSSHVSTTSGGECSSTAIRAVIKKLVAAEDPKKPLSDNKIATLLEEQGIKVARRTIAKYREAMSIPPSNERKRLV